MAETQTATVESAASPDCSICERSLLVGESLRMFRDRDDRTHSVCELCRDKARRRGLEHVGPSRTPRLRVQPSSALTENPEHERLIEGMGKELAYLKEELGAAHLALTEHSLQADTVRAITDKLRRQERELERMRREHDPARRAEEQRALQQQGRELRELRAQARQKDEQVARLQLARQAETSSIRMCGFALDAFNSSEHADRMARIARTLDAPEVTVSDEGSQIPRRVHVTLVWDIAWYHFLVKLDVGTGRASVHEVANGGDPGKLPLEQRKGNARWRDSGLVLG